jgi:sulfatase modifying factor 1
MTPRSSRPCVAWIVFRSLAFLMAMTAPAAAVTIDWVTVGDAGNEADTAGLPNPAGGVAYEYRIMRYEWTNSQYVAYLNAVDPDGSNPNGIWRTAMGTNVRGGVSFTSGNANGAKYQARANMGDKPVNYISWFQAARVANWLHNGSETYTISDATATAPQNTGAYTLGTGTNGSAPAKNGDARFWIPTEDEWYKAAYYKGGGMNAGYWIYPTQSDTAPLSVTASLDGQGSAGALGNFANFALGADWNGQDGNVTTVGTNGRASAYGAFDLGGNIGEFNDLTGAAGSSRGLRGANWQAASVSLMSTSGRNSVATDFVQNYSGFRLASPVAVPEPSTLALGLAGFAWAAWAAQRRRRY